MGRLMGLEPTTSGITIQHSNQLSYSRHGPYRLARQVRKCQGQAVVEDRRNFPQAIVIKVRCPWWALNEGVLK